MSNHTLRSPEQIPTPSHQLRDSLAGLLAQQQIARQVVFPDTLDPDMIVGDFFPPEPQSLDSTIIKF